MKCKKLLIPLLLIFSFFVSFSYVNVQAKGHGGGHSSSHSSSKSSHSSTSKSSSSGIKSGSFSNSKATTKSTTIPKSSTPTKPTTPKSTTGIKSGSFSNSEATKKSTAAPKTSTTTKSTTSKSATGIKSGSFSTTKTTSTSTEKSTPTLKNTVNIKSKALASIPPSYSCHSISNNYYYNTSNGGSNFWSNYFLYRALTPEHRTYVTTTGSNAIAPAYTGARSIMADIITLIFIVGAIVLVVYVVKKKNAKKEI